MKIPSLSHNVCECGSHEHRKGAKLAVNTMILLFTMTAEMAYTVVATEVLSSHLLGSICQETELSE